MGSRDGIPAQTSEVVTLELALYVHTQRVTASMEQGIESVDVVVILCRGNRRGAWRLDSVDFGDLLLLAPGRFDGVRPLVMEGLMDALYQRGFDPGAVRGWGRWFNGNHIAETLAKYSERKAS